MSWSELEMKVIRWAEDRRIIPNATPVSQLLKAVSEMGELADAEGKRDRAAIEDAVGDVLVCLINYCALRDLDMTRCLAGAYEQIKDRRGTLMPDGTFVKEQGMNEHTTGPWKAVYVGCSDWDLNGPVTEQDWKLAAAAPELLDALETMLVQFTKTPSTLKDSEARVKAHAAIAKATGGQP